jgi:hypothetical protein
MALQFFGPNRMAAQQAQEDRGTSLVARRPSWGLGPQGMPGSADYNPNPRRGVFMRDAGGGDEPNAYERGGFFWDGSGIRQGTPIGHMDQQREHNEQEQARRWARQALEDKQHGLQVRDVDARIRNADRSHDMDQRRFGMDVDRLGMAREGQQFDQGMRKRGILLDEQREQRSAQGQEFDQDVRRRGILMDEQTHGSRMDRERMERDVAQDQLFNPPNRRAEAQGAAQNQVAELVKSNPGRFTARSEAAALRSGDVNQLQPQDVVHGNEARWLERLQKINPRMRAVSRKGKPTEEGLSFLERVNELSRVPEFYRATDDELAQLAADGAYFDPQYKDWFVQLPDGDIMRVRF